MSFRFFFRRSFRLIFLRLLFLWSLFVGYSKCGDSSIELPQSFMLTWNITPLPSVPNIFFKSCWFNNLSALYVASGDDRVRGLNIFLRGGITLGMAFVQELLSIIDLFKSRGKVVNLYCDEISGVANFLLFSSANTRGLSNFSNISIPGFSMDFMFEKLKLEKKGINVWAYRYGEFKFPPLMQVGTKLDFNASVNIRAFLNDLLLQSKVALNHNLNLSCEDSEKLFSHGYFSARDFKDLGFCNCIGLSKFMKQTTSEKLPNLDLNFYANLFHQGSKSFPPQVAVVRIDFMLEPRTCDTFKTYIEDLAKIKSLKVVILWLDCPGGDIDSAITICDSIKSLKKNGKYVIALVNELAASGGYMIASVANVIFARPASIVGSIGAYTYHHDMLGALKKKGITVDSITTHGESSIALLSNKLKSFLKRELKGSYWYFFNFVSKNRFISCKNMKDIARGQIFTANAAKKLGLVDSLEGLYGALELTCKLCNNDSLRFIFVPRLEISWFRQMLLRLAG